MKFPLLAAALGVALLLAFTRPAIAADPSDSTTPKGAEYKRADHNYYLKSDVLNVDSDAEIIPPSGYTQVGDTYYVPGERKRIVYAEVMNDWLEPITPPGATTLGVPPTAMQILDPQGDIQVAFPAAPATFVPVQNGMTIANGTVVKTGANGTAAVVFGGVASARFTPNSEAAVQQNMSASTRSMEVDLTHGAVFSKIGKLIGEKEDYTVHTPMGVAAARGTDFVTVVMPTRVDVWIAEGTVQLNQTNGAMVGQVSAEETGGLKIIRYPGMSDAHDSMMADAQTMTAAMNFIPMANQNVKDLHDQLTTGQKMSDSDRQYLGRIKKVPCLIKLVFLAPPAPPPAPAPKPPKPSTSAKPAASASTTSNTP